MLFPNKTLQAERQKLATRLLNEGVMESGILPLETLEAALSFDPHSSFFLNAAAMRALNANDNKGALDFVLRGLTAAPHLPIFYLHWQELLSRGYQDSKPDEMTRSLAFELAVRKGNLYFDSWMLCKPNEFSSPEMDLTDWKQVEKLAATLAAKHSVSRGITADWDRHMFFQDFLEQAEWGFDLKFIDELAAQGPSIRPMIEGLLRSYADSELEPPSYEAVALSTAILGVIGEARHLTWLLELEAEGGENIVSAAGWAFQQLAKEHPDRAVAAIRDYAAECDSECLPALADHLWHLRKVKHAVPIMEILLESIPDVPSESRDQMFMTLAESMARADIQAAQAILPKAYREIRRKVNRTMGNALEAILNGAEPHASMLSEAFVQQSFRDFCKQLAVKDSAGEEDEEAEQDLKDEGEPEPPRVRQPAWYDPSGKIRALQKKIGGSLHEVMTKQEFKRGFKMFSEGAQELPDSYSIEMRSEAHFMDWVIHDYTSQGLPAGVLMHYFTNHSGLFSKEEKDMLRSWSKTSLTLLEVLQTEPGKGAKAKDAFTGETFFVQDVGMSNEVNQFEFLLARLLPFEAGWILSGDGTRVDRRHVPRLVEWANGLKKKQQSWPEFLKQRGPAIRLKVYKAYAEFMENVAFANAEGEPMLFCEAQFELLDKTAVVSILDTHPALERKDRNEEIYFDWLDAPGSAQGGRRSFGSIRIKGRDMVLECNSEGRLERGRKMLEQVLAGKIGHLGDKITSPREGMNQPQSKRAEQGVPEIPGIPMEVQHKMVEQYLEQHYEAWIDLPLPALHDKSPREAAASKQHRPLLEELLKEGITRSEQERKSGKPSYDFRKMAVKLGFKELV